MCCTKLQAAVAEEEVPLVVYEVRITISYLLTLIWCFCPISCGLEVLLSQCFHKVVQQHVQASIASMSFTSSQMQCCCAVSAARAWRGAVLLHACWSRTTSDTLLWGAGTQCFCVGCVQLNPYLYPIGIVSGPQTSAPSCVVNLSVEEMHLLSIPAS